MDDELPTLGALDAPPSKASPGLLLFAALSILGLLPLLHAALPLTLVAFRLDF